MQKCKQTYYDYKWNAMQTNTSFKRNVSPVSSPFNENQHLKKLSKKRRE